MQQLKRKAEEHIVEWIRLLGATWLQNTRENLVQLEALLGSRNEASSTEGGTLSRDGSIDIDIEMLLIGVRESWHRLGHYGIQVLTSVVRFKNAMLKITLNSFSVKCTNFCLVVCRYQMI